LDYGETWQPVDETDRSFFDVAISSDGKIMMAVTAMKIWKSLDHGQTWQEKHSTSNSYKIAVSSNGKYQVVNSGWGKLSVSVDYGETWQAKDSDREWGGLAMSSNGRSAWVLANGALYRSLADTIIDGKVFTTNLNISGLQEGDSGLSTGDLYYVVDSTVKYLCIK